MRTTALDRPARRVATTLIRKFGKRVTYIHKAPPAHDTSTGKTTGAEASHVVHVIVPRIWNGLIEGKVTQVGEVVLMVPAADLPDITPTALGRVQVGSAWKQIEKVDPLYSGENVYAWILQAKL